MSKHNPQISVYKGIAILLVVLGHAGCGDLLGRIIYLFHMPLFYFISGYLFKDKYLDTTKSFFLHKIKGLYVPFVVYSLIFLLLHNLLVRVHFDSIVFSIHNLCEGILKAFLFLNIIPMQSQVWFFRSLFISLIIFYVVIWLGHRFYWHNYMVMVLLGFIFLSGLLISRFGILLPLHFNRDMVCVGFIGLGYFCKKYNLLNYTRNCNLYLTGVSILLLLSLGIVGYREDYQKAIFTNPLVLILGGISGIYLIWIISQHLVRIGKIGNLLALFGDLSLYIFIFHVFFFRLGNIFKVWFFHLDVNRIADIQIIYDPNNGLWTLFYVLTATFLSTILGLGILKLKDRVFSYIHPHRHYS